MTSPHSAFVNAPSAIFNRQFCSARTSFLQRDEIRVANHARIAWSPAKPHTAPILKAALESPQAPTAIKLDGKGVAADIRKQIAEEVSQIVSDHGESARPGLAVVMVGERRDSATYVRNKRRACEEVGFSSIGFNLPIDTPQEELYSVIDSLNKRDDVHGILVQLPLPDHIDDEQVLDRIAVEKDVDGFHPLNIGRLCLSGRSPPLFVPCTPKGCVELLDRYNIPIEGKNAVVLGRSNIVGLPVAMLLLHRNATVTICHSRTKDTESQIRQADILIAACGIAEFVKPHWLKPDVVIVDVGINAVDDSTKKRGYRLVGDVEYAGAANVASYITPVPGGVGPMTISMLLMNTLNASKRRVNMK